MRRATARYETKWIPLKTDLSPFRAVLSSDDDGRKISTPRWSVNGPIDTKARIKRWWLFHLRAEISFAHLGTCRRRHRHPPSVRRESAQIERILTSTLKRKRFRIPLDKLTESVIIICYCVIAITRWLLTNRISLRLNIAHAGCTLSSRIVACSKLQKFRPRN